MSGGKYIEIAGGSITETYEGDYEMFAENIYFRAGKQVTSTGVENGTSYGVPSSPPAIGIPLLSDAIIHFRPKKDWKGKDYGFDWMRIDDTGIFGDDKYEDMVGTYDKQPSADSTATFTKSPALYNTLKNEYHHFIYTVPWLDKGKFEYFPSWLCVEKNKEIELSLRIQIKDKKALPQKLVVAYDKAVFEITSSLGKGTEDAVLDPTKNKHYTSLPVNKDTDYKLGNEIKLKTLADITAPQTITVLCDGKEAGFLKVYPNKVKKLDVVCVKVKIQISNSATEGKIIGKNELTTFLNQALILPNFVELPLDITTKANQPNPDLNNSTSIIKNGKIDVSKLLSINENGVQNDYSLTQYLDLRLKEAYKNNDGTGKYDNYLRLYYLNEDAIINDGNGNDLPVGGIGTPIGGGSAIMYKTISLPDVVHESLHSMGLGHTFGIRFSPMQKIVFKYKQTENLMDYAHLDTKDKYSTWKWQWDILRNFKFLT